MPIPSPMRQMDISSNKGGNRFVDALTGELGDDSDPAGDLRTAILFADVFQPIIHG